ncbi:MAG: hypothetical protein WED32_02955, partial [Patescibacteria group bacterium]
MTLPVYRLGVRNAHDPARLNIRERCVIITSHPLRIMKAQADQVEQGEPVFIPEKAAPFFDKALG